MSTTWITTVKIAGPCCNQLAERLNKWHDIVGLATEAKDENVPALHSPAADASEIEIRRLLTLLEAHARRPPVLFFHKHLDARTMNHEHFLSSELPIGHMARTVTCNDVSLWFLPLEMGEEVRQGLKNVNSASAQLEEARALFTILRLGVESWQALLQPRRIPSALLLFFDRVGGSWMDREVISESETLPEWLPRLTSSSDPVR